MATNLFEAFDSAFAEPRPSLAGTLIAAINRRLDELRRRRRRARDTRKLLEMPAHLQKDVGVVAWGGRLWPIAGNGTDAGV